MKKEKDVFFGTGDYLNFKSSKMLTTYNMLKLKTTGNDFVTLEVKISADFDTIPEEYHEVFFNIMSSKYLDTVSFGDNPFSKCIPPKKKKWWEFWKANLSI